MGGKEAFVLVVDDDENVLSLVVTRLEMAGYNVTSATDAWAEIVQAEGLKIGLIITDIQMPGLGTGVDAIKKLRANPRISPLMPVLFMTGMRPEEAEKIVPLTDPKVRLIHKPIDFKVMQAKIKELTGLDRQL